MRPIVLPLTKATKLTTCNERIRAVLHVLCTQKPGIVTHRHRNVIVTVGTNLIAELSTHLPLHLLARSRTELNLFWQDNTCEIPFIGIYII